MDRDIWQVTIRIANIILYNANVFKNVHYLLIICAQLSKKISRIKTANQLAQRITTTYKIERWPG